MNLQQRVRAPELELLDILYVPSSLLRLTHRKVQNGELQPKEEYKDSKFTKALPYIMASYLEVARLGGYYLLGKAVADNFF